MGTHFHRCGMGSICSARSSHGDRFVALPSANGHRHPRLRNAPPKHGVDEPFAPSGTCLASHQAALSSSQSDSAPFNAHSFGIAGAA